MARSDPNERIDRLFRHPSGQDELFDKSCEEVLDARRGEPVECLGLTFENDEAQRSHYAPYHRKPFAVDVSEGKAHPVYRAHGYHTKVLPHGRRLAFQRGPRLTPRRGRRPTP